MFDRSEVKMDEEMMEKAMDDLYLAYCDAQSVCRPDVYQARMNNLTIAMAEYLLADRFKALQEDKEDDDE